jgi:hypothetical protein
MSKDNRRLTVFNALQLQENRDTALTLMRYTFLMFVAPIVTFYALRTYVHGTSHAQWADMYAGFAAVGVANCVIIAYIVMAFNEDPGPKSPRDSDPSSSLKKTD